MCDVLLFLLANCLAGVHGQGDANSLFMWGDDYNGQLGDGATTNQPFPKAVSVSGKNLATLKLGDHHTGAITTDGALYLWGSNEHGQIGTGSTLFYQYSSPTAITVAGKSFKALALGNRHSGAIDTDGALYMWGDNFFAQIGDGTIGGDRYSPTLITVPGRLFTTLALGDWHSGAITIGRSLYMWGYNAQGQLGDGTTIQRYAPIEILSLGASVTILSLGNSHSGAINEFGVLYMWGLNQFGQLGDGTVTERHSPTVISVSGKTFATLALGISHTGAITTDGKLYMWGDNFDGQIGDGTKTFRYTPTEIVVSGKSFSKLALGMGHSGAITTDGKLYMWGFNFNGQIGSGVALNLSPTEITISGKSITALALGAYHTGAITIASPSPSPNASPSPRASASPKPSPVSPSRSPPRSASPPRSPSQSAPPSRSPSRSAPPSRSPSRSAAPSRSPSRSGPPSRSPLRSVSPSRSPLRSASPSRSPSRSARPLPSPSLSPGEQCNVQQCSATAMYWKANCGGCIHLGNSMPLPCSPTTGVSGTSAEAFPFGRRASQATADTAVDGTIKSSNSAGSDIYASFGASIWLLLGIALGAVLSTLVHRMPASPVQSVHFSGAVPQTNVYE